GVVLEVVAEQLDGDKPIQAGIARQIERSHAASAETALDLVPAYALKSHGWKLERYCHEPGWAEVHSAAPRDGSSDGRRSSWHPSPVPAAGHPPPASAHSSLTRCTPPDSSPSAEVSPSGVTAMAVMA